MESHILTLIFITLGVFLIPFVAPLFGLPVAVGELLYGIGLFYFFEKFHLCSSTFQYIDFLSFLGFSLLMFLAGLEIDWNKLETLKGREKLVITLVVFTNFLMALTVVWILKLSLEQTLLLGSMGIGLLLSVVRELNLSPKMVQLILITGSLGEITTLLGLTFYDLYLTSGLGYQFVLHASLVVFLGLLFMFLLKVLKLLVWYFPEKVASLIQSENKAAVDIRAIFALMLTFMALGYLVHIEPILGAFIAGVLFGFIFREKQNVEQKLSAFGYGFLIPFFFIQVGFSFKPSYLTEWEMVKETFLLLGLLYFTKLVSSFWFTFIGFKLKEVFISSFLFSFPFTILIAVAKILHEKGIWNDFQMAKVIMLTVLTAILFPFLIKKLAK